MKRQRLSLRTRKPLLTHREPVNACVCVWRARLPADNNVPATCGPGNGSCSFVLSLFPAPQDVARNPFGMFDNVMANVRNRMEDMHRNFVSLPPLPSSAPIGLDPLAGFECTTVRLVFQESMSTDSNAHSFHSSSVMTYSKVGNEPPKVFQASTSTRCAPGGVSCVSRGGQMLPELQEVFGW